MDEKNMDARFSKKQFFSNQISQAVYFFFKFGACIWYYDMILPLKGLPL